MEGVYTIALDQCNDEIGAATVVMPTTVITNMRSGTEILGERSRGGHRHSKPIGDCANSCARLPSNFLDAVLKYMEIECMAKKYGTLCNVDELHCEDSPIENCEEHAGFYDDLTWEPRCESRENWSHEGVGEVESPRCVRVGPEEVGDREGCQDH